MIDTHCHLTGGACGGKQALKDGANAGVNNFIVVGFDLPSSYECVDFCKDEDNVFCAVGIHPSDCETCDNSAIDQLFILSQDKKCVAIGEIGLDYHYGKENKEEQKNAFAKQIELAISAKLPFVVHTREATKDTLDIISAYKGQLDNGFLLHCYSDSKESVKNYLDLGAYFALGGAITFKNAKKEDVIKAIPQDRIMAETDCPYMTPVPHRGEPNAPKYVTYVYDKLCEVYGENKEQFIKKVRENVARLFYKGQF